MELDDIIGWFFDVWKVVKKFVKYTIESNFTCVYDFAFFIILFGILISVILVFTLSSYSLGYDHGQTEGLIRGFANGTNFIDSGK